MLTESGEIGAIALKAFSLIEMELTRSIKEVKVVNICHKAVENVVIFKSLKWSMGI